MAGNVFENYLHDLGWEVRRIAESTSGTDEFDRGVRMGLFEVVALMQSQALVFGLTPAQVGLDGFDAERTLLHEP